MKGEGHPGREMADFMTSTHRAKWIFVPQDLVICLCFFSFSFFFMPRFLPNFVWFAVT